MLLLFICRNDSYSSCYDYLCVEMTAILLADYLCVEMTAILLAVIISM